ncbi:hypothetical protein, partial [Conchiformibius kuhniae]|uniref:hypothetical protein n=1 Tax=Conchiformibius kuhniae TaxID=211502 RepID=UPI001B7FC74D
RACHHLNFYTENSVQYKKIRHSRECGNPPPDAWQAVFYQGFSCFNLDFCLRGHDGTAFFRLIDDTP